MLTFPLELDGQCPLFLFYMMRNVTWECGKAVLTIEIIFKVLSI